jgi:hypothetical protein
MKFDIAVFHHDANRCLWIQGILLQRRVAVDSAGERDTQTVIMDLGWRHFDLIDNVLDARRGFHDRKCRVAVRVVPHPASHHRNSVLDI